MTLKYELKHQWVNVSSDGIELGTYATKSEAVRKASPGTQTLKRTHLADNRSKTGREDPDRGGYHTGDIKTGHLREGGDRGAQAHQN